MAPYHFDPLQRALSSLEEILAQPKNKFIRAGTIQCFEYTFELSWKAMQRILKDQGLIVGSPMQVFREAVQVGLIANAESWAAFLKQRNLTVHSYNEDVAEEVYRAAQSFPAAVRALLPKLVAASSSRP